MPVQKRGTKSYKHYHKDGSLWAEGKMAAGKMDGLWKWFRKDGTKMRSGYFKAGKQVKKWTTFNKTGVVVKVTDFSK